MTTDELPVFPTSAPPVFSDGPGATSLFAEVFPRLARVIDIDDDHRNRPTPCQQFTVAQLQTHTLGWLDFFATALGDPTANAPRPDPEEFRLAPGVSAAGVVEQAARQFDAAIAAGVSSQLVTMSSARMAGDGVLGMALGEYIVHAWDLATATGRSYEVADEAAAAAHEFLATMVQPEHRGPDTGFFDAEVAVATDAGPLDRLLGFAGRNPQWSASS